MKHSTVSQGVEVLDARGSSDGAEFCCELGFALETPASHKRNERTIETAIGQTYWLISEYWKLAADGVGPLRSPKLFGFEVAPCDKETRQQLRARAVAIARLEREVASFEIGRFYMSQLPSDFRASNGVYYTPPALVRRLLDTLEGQGVSWRQIKVLDPACGGGAFVAPVIERKIRASRGMSARKCIQEIGVSVKGIEIDPFAAWLSQVFADLTAAELCKHADERLPLLVEVADALSPRAEEEGAYDLVVGNPPYTRVSPEPSVRHRYARSLYGHANLYGLFTDQALRLTRVGGLIAYVTPTSFLGGQYFKNLRTLLRMEAPPVQLDFVAERSGVFDDVLQETLLAVYRKGSKARSVSVGTVEVVDADSCHRHIGNFTMSVEKSGAWVLPRTEGQRTLINASRHLSHTLKDYGFQVNTGPLVWNRFKPQLKSQPGKNRFPVIWAESVTSDCKFSFSHERRNHEPYFEWRSDRDNWLLVTTPCVLVQRTTAKEQQRRLIASVLPQSFIRTSKAVVVENHLNMIRPATSRPHTSIEAIAAVLRSQSADTLFRCISGSVAVSAYELESLPLPDLASFKQIESAIENQEPEESIQALINSFYTDSFHAAPI